MEITTTMIHFTLPKAAMATSTEKAQLFVFHGENGTSKVWVPLTKFEVREKNEMTVEVAMAKWLYMKSDLPIYTQPHEFIVTSHITAEDLFNNI